MTEYENHIDEHVEEHEDEHVELYAGGTIKSGDGAVPKWIHAAGVIVLIWGILWFYLYWNGSHGWFDRGYWGELQEAANTTYYQNN